MFDALAPVLLLIGVPTLVLLTVRRLNLRDCRHEPPADSPHTGGRTVGSEPPHGPTEPHPPGSRRTRHTPRAGAVRRSPMGSVLIGQSLSRQPHHRSESAKRGGIGSESRMTWREHSAAGSSEHPHACAVETRQGWLTV